MTVRFGVIGYGAWGTLHARAIQQLEGCELAAIAVPSEQSRARASEETGVPVLADYRHLLALDAVDAVSIVSPNHLHEPIALDALAAGKHVLLEKPMALTVEGCDRLISAAERAGRKLLVGHELHFSPLYTEMHRLICEGRIGRPRYMLVDLWRRPYRQGSGGWKQDPQRVGSWTLEEPVHYFDLASWFFESCGQPQSVTAFGNRRETGAPAGPRPKSAAADERERFPLAGIHDNFTAVLQFADGAYAVISQSLSAVEHHLGIRVFGSSGVLRTEWHAEHDRSLRPSFALSISEGTRMLPLPVDTPPTETFELSAEIRAFAAAIEKGHPLPFSAAAARRAVALCIAAEQSIETGRTVETRI